MKRKQQGNSFSNIDISELYKIEFSRISSIAYFEKFNRYLTSAFDSVIPHFAWK